MEKTKASVYYYSYTSLKVDIMWFYFALAILQGLQDILAVCDCRDNQLLSYIIIMETYKLNLYYSGGLLCDRL